MIPGEKKELMRFSSAPSPPTDDFTVDITEESFWMY
jgi:hypothetical protein